MRAERLVVMGISSNVLELYVAVYVDLKPDTMMVHHEDIVLVYVGDSGVTQHCRYMIRQLLNLQERSHACDARATRLRGVVSVHSASIADVF